MGFSINVCRCATNHVVLREFRAVVQRQLRPDVRNDKLRRPRLRFMLHMPELHRRLRAMQHVWRAASDAAASLRHGVLFTVQHLRFRLLDMLKLCRASGDPDFV